MAGKNVFLPGEISQTSRSKACCEKSAESIVVGPVADEGSNLLEFGTRLTKSHGAEKKSPVCKG